MTPKEKAKELYDKYWLIVDTKSVNKCALIAVDEIINNSLEYMGCRPEEGEIIYWKEVKQEIEKL